MPGIDHLSLAMALLLVAFLAPVFLFIRLARKGRKLYLRRLPGVDAIEEAIGRAVEMGRPVAFSTGITSVDQVFFACLGIIRHVARRSALYGTRLLLPQFDLEALPIVQNEVAQIYRAAGKESSFDSANIPYLSTQCFAYASGFMGLAHREKVAACFYFGRFSTETLLLTEAGLQIGAIQVAGTTSHQELPFFIITCDYTMIGEEMYAASAYLSRDPVLLGGLRGQDVAKLIVFLLIIAGVIWATATGNEEYGVGLAKWILPANAP